MKRLYVVFLAIHMGKGPWWSFVRTGYVFVTLFYVNDTS